MLYQLSYFRKFFKFTGLFRGEQCCNGRAKIYLFFELPKRYTTKKENYLQRRLKLFEKAQVVFKVEAEVFDLPFEHGNPFYAHAKGKS